MLSCYYLTMAKFGKCKKCKKVYKHTALKHCIPRPIFIGKLSQPITKTKKKKVKILPSRTEKLTEAIEQKGFTPEQWDNLPITEKIKIYKSSLEKP